MSAACIRALVAYQEKVSRKGEGDEVIYLPVDFIGNLFDALYCQ